MKELAYGTGNQQFRLGRSRLLSRHVGFHQKMNSMIADNAERSDPARKKRERVPPRFHLASFRDILSAENVRSLGKKRRSHHDLDESIKAI